MGEVGEVVREEGEREEEERGHEGEATEGGGAEGSGAGAGEDGLDGVAGVAGGSGGWGEGAERGEARGVEAEGRAELGSPEVEQGGGWASKSRLRWTPKLHEKFMMAVDSLGGLMKATPKTVLDCMDDPRLTIFHIKSHLQKIRTHLRVGSDVDAALGSLGGGSGAGPGGVPGGGGARGERRDASGAGPSSRWAPPSSGNHDVPAPNFLMMGDARPRRLGSGGVAYPPPPPSYWVGPGLGEGMAAGAPAGQRYLTEMQDPEVLLNEDMHGSGPGDDGGGAYYWPRGREGTSSDDLYLQMAIQRKVHEQLENHRIMQEELQVHTRYIQQLQNKLKLSEQHLAEAEVLHVTSLRGGRVNLTPGGGMQVPEPNKHDAGVPQTRPARQSRSLSNDVYDAYNEGGYAAHGVRAAPPPPKRARARARASAQKVTQPLSRASSDSRDVDIVGDGDILVDVPNALDPPWSMENGLSFAEFPEVQHDDPAFGSHWIV